MLLANGTTITPVTKNEKIVRMNDPLVLEESEEVQNLGGPSKDYGEIVIEFDDKNPMGEIIDPQTGEPAQCAFIFRRLSVETVRTAPRSPWWVLSIQNQCQSGTLMPVARVSLFCVMA